MDSVVTVRLAGLGAIVVIMIVSVVVAARKRRKI